jgi:hypothetical protein
LGEFAPPRGKLERAQLKEQPKIIPPAKPATEQSCPANTDRIEENARAFKKIFGIRREELNRPQDLDRPTDKVLDSPAKSRAFSDFTKDHGGPKTAQKDPNNPGKPDGVRSIKGKRVKG